MLKVLEGKVIRGFGEGAKYVSKPVYNLLLTELLDEQPYPGTLNVETGVSYKKIVKECPPSHVKSVLIDGVERGGFFYWFGDVLQKDKRVMALILRPFLSRHMETVLEIVSGMNLRKELGLDDGASVMIKLICGEQPKVD